MSTTTEEAENVYEVRGRRVQINYDEDEHSATFHSPDIGKELEGATNPQEALKDLGIYTRVQEVTQSGRTTVTVKLKPAASVELRASPEEGTTLEARPISKQFDGSTISKRRGKYGYTATCGMEKMEAVGLEHKAAASMYAELHNGRLHLRVEPGDAPHSMTTRIDSTGLIGVPNGLGAAADLDGHGVNWEIIEDGDALLGETTFEPKEMSMPSEVDDPNAHPSDRHYTAAITHVVQDDYEYEGETRTQTHFTVYVKSDFVEALGWGADADLFERDDAPTREEVLQNYVDIHLVNVENDLALYITDDLREKYVDDVDITEEGDGLWDASVRTAPCIRKLYSNQLNSQITFNFPHSLAHALQFTDEWPSPKENKDIARGKHVKWGITEGSLLGLPLDLDDVDKDPL